MSRGILPIVLAVVLISVVTVVEGVYLKDRWAAPAFEAAELGQRFSRVPISIGEWTGTDMPVSIEVKERSGAVNFVNRRYSNENTGVSVDLWLIIGHARDIIRHTPNICYPNSGFLQQGSQLRHTVFYDGDQEARFFTSKFQKEDPLVRQTQRVFWAWNRPDLKKWDAPDKARFHYGMATRAMYKMYFTSGVTSDEDTLDDNAAAEFAELVLPVIDAALFGEETSPETESPESSDQNPLLEIPLLETPLPETPLPETESSEPIVES